MRRFAGWLPEFDRWRDLHAVGEIGGLRREVQSI
jgi:hypothetical protein